mgnify:CR=1 FL=1
MVFRARVAIFAGLLIAILTISVSILNHFNQPKSWTETGSRSLLGEKSAEQGTEWLKVVNLKPSENETLPPLDGQDEHLFSKPGLLSEQSKAKEGSEARSVQKKPKAKVSHPPIKFPIKINKATRAELMALPGIGEVLADRIIEKRKELGGFKKPEDLLLVKGIGKKKLEKIRGLITLE